MFILALHSTFNNLLMNIPQNTETFIDRHTAPHTKKEQIPPHI